MKIDLSHIPMIDNHAHPFPSAREPKDNFEQIFSFSLDWQKPENLRSTVAFDMYTRRLKAFLGLAEETSFEMLMAERHKRLFGNRREYIDALFSDVKLEGIVSDMGFPVSKKLMNAAEHAEYDDDIKGYIDARIDRIEWVCEDILESGTHSFEEFTQLYKEKLRAKTKEPHMVGLKSIIAYKTGLHVKVLSQAEFKKAYYLYLADPLNREREKALRDYCFCVACEVCAELDLPLQVHTGPGDGPMLNILYANPALLYDAVNAYPNTRIMLIHAGWPYCEELGFMMNHYDNVYGDVSEILIFSGCAGDTKLRDILEMAPTNKLMYGSDGGGTVENLWYAAKMFRLYFTNTLQELVDKGFISYQFAMEAAQNVMHDNAKRFYGI